MSTKYIIYNPFADRPTPLQIDGETILNVTSYSVCAVNKKPKAAPYKWVPTR